jgi:hypothetical protein
VLSEWSTATRFMLGQFSSLTFWPRLNHKRKERTIWESMIMSVQCTKPLRNQSYAVHPVRKTAEDKIIIISIVTSCYSVSVHESGSDPVPEAYYTIASGQCI